MLIYGSTGYLSLMEKYVTPGHMAKRKIFDRAVPAAVLELMLEECTGVPGLFVYSPDRSDWYFCEVKGPGDELGKAQVRWAKRPHELTGKRVCIRWLKELRL